MVLAIVKRREKHFIEDLIPLVLLAEKQEEKLNFPVTDEGSNLFC